MAAPKRRGLEYRTLCSGVGNQPSATYVIANRLGVPRSIAKRSLESLQRKGLVVKHVADRTGGSGPGYGADRMDFIDGRVKKVFLWARASGSKAQKKITARCELDTSASFPRHRISRSR